MGKIKADLTHHLPELLRLVELDEKGRPSQIMTGPSHAPLALLAAELMHSRSLPDDEWLSQTFVTQTLGSIKRDGLERPTWSEYKSAQKSVVDTYFARPFLKWLVICPLHLSGTWIKSKRRINVFGRTLSRLSWRRARKISGWAAFAADLDTGRRPEARRVNIDNFTPVLAEVSCRSYGEAVDQAAEAVEILLALLNLSVTWHRWVMQMGRASPLGSCLPAPVYGAFRADGTYKGCFVSNDEISYRKAIEVDREGGRQLEGLLRRLDRNEGKFRQLVVDVLLKYQMAVSTTDWRLAYLYLWQILEATARSPSRSPLGTDEVLRRLLILSGGASFIAEAAPFLREWRNDFVHRGEFSRAGLMRVNCIKLVAEAAIAGLVGLPKPMCSVEALKEYYLQYSVQPSTLETRRKAIDRVLRQKQT